MRKIIMTTIAGLAMFGATAALARGGHHGGGEYEHRGGHHESGHYESGHHGARSFDAASCGSGATADLLDARDIVTRVADLGYRVRETGRSGDCWKVHAIHRDGREMELYLHPRTGEIVGVDDHR